MTSSSIHSFSCSPESPGVDYTFSQKKKVSSCESKHKKKVLTRDKLSTTHSPVLPMSSVASEDVTDLMKPQRNEPQSTVATQTTGGDRSHQCQVRRTRPGTGPAPCACGLGQSAWWRVRELLGCLARLCVLHKLSRATQTLPHRGSSRANLSALWQTTPRPPERKHVHTL